MIIGDFPSFRDDENNTLMTSAKDVFIDDIFNNVITGFDPNDVYKSYVLKCRPPEGTKPNAKQLTACRDYTMAEIEAIRPKAILLVGDLPTKSLLNMSGITKLRGTIQKLQVTEDYAVECYPIFASGYIDANPHLLKQYAEDILRAYNASLGIEAKIEQSRIVHCDTMKKVRQLFEFVRHTGMLSLDFETTAITDKGTFDENFKVTLTSISFQHGSAWTIPMEHAENPFTAAERAEILELLADAIADPDIHKVAHNANYELHVLYFLGIFKIRGRFDDTMLMHHLIDETLRHGLKGIISDYYPNFKGYELEVGKYSWDAVPMKILSPYGGIDADMTLRLRDLFEAELLRDEKLYRVYRNLTSFCLRPLFKAEHRGMRIDKDLLLTSINRAQELLDEQQEKLRQYKQVKNFEAEKSAEINEAKIIELEQKIEDTEAFENQTPTRVKNIADWKACIRDMKQGLLSYYDGINFASPDQLGELLYSRKISGFKFRAPYDWKTRSEKWKTDKDTLETLPDTSGFVEGLRLYRSVAKTLSTYLISIYEKLSEEDKQYFIHTSFLIHGTKSGRLSSEKPNLQNLPAIAKLKDPLAIEVTSMVKKVFVPRPDHWMFQADYVQAELRIIADMAEEQTMLQAYKEDKDLHAVTGAFLMQLSMEEFMALPPYEYKKGRTNAKPANFGLIYGQSAKGYKTYAKSNYQLELTDAESEDTRNAFFELYPELLNYHDEMIERAQKFGYVRTVYGRKRHAPNINSSDEFLRGEDERSIINSPVQGSAGEFMIFALSLLDIRLDPRVLIDNTVHDSLIFEIPKSMPIAEVRQQVALIRYTMENLPNMQFFHNDLREVFMKADVEVSDVSWKDLSEYNEETFAA